MAWSFLCLFSQPRGSNSPLWPFSLFIKKLWVPWDCSVQLRPSQHSCFGAELSLWYSLRMFLNTVKPRCLGPSHPDKSLGWGQSESARVESRDWQLAAPQALAFFLFIYLCAGSSLLLTLSLAAESKGCSSCSAQASHCSIFFCCLARDPEQRTWVVAAARL